jgi:hypothetical protein
LPQLEQQKLAHAKEAAGRSLHRYEVRYADSGARDRSQRRTRSA